ncbi:hypothetical protein QTI24_16015 [Variovorax sp. J22P240]|nr:MULTISPECIES: hypothetical protein [unclassified Variovorax]MDM0000125.1 hypothetical protein [Variovorax sp. J22P240]MDM0051221.1 hypothetical protein [Variovorax sp. J22R115]
MSSSDAILYILAAYGVAAALIAAEVWTLLRRSHTQSRLLPPPEPHDEA